MTKRSLEKSRLFEVDEKALDKTGKKAYNKDDESGALLSLVWLTL